VDDARDGGEHDGNRTLTSSFFLLGSLVVHDDRRRPLIVKDNEARALLALLLVRANRHVPTDQLAHELWDGAPPRGARSTIHAHLSRLRALLGSTNGSAALNIRAGGYALHVDLEELDVHRFEVLARRGSDALDDDPQLAGALLTKALDEWRGPALQGVRHIPSLQLEAARLDELRLATAEARMAADLATGGAAHVLALAETNDPSATAALRAAVARLPEVRKHWLWLGTVALLADACVHLGDRRAAGDLYRALWPHRAEADAVALGVALLGPIKPRLDALSRLAERDIESAR
jgi:DNA-binding SARP family transcriptional activator